MQSLLPFTGGRRSPAFHNLDRKDAPLLDMPSSTSSFGQRLLGPLSRFRARLYAVYTVIIGALVVAHIARLNPRIAAHIWRPTHAPPTEMHIVIPAIEPSLGLCRTLLTGAVLNYPVPTLITWGKTFNDTKLVDGGAQLGRLTAVQDWTFRLRPEQREGLAVILDTEDSWMQLRPNVLLDRFKWLIKDTNRLTHKRMERGYSEERIVNTMIMAARKRCEPNVEDDIGCYPAPVSPLPADTYGANTDTENGYNRFSSVRPKYLSPAMIMGPMGDIHQVLLRAISKKDIGQHVQQGSTRFIYNSIYGEQEFMREVFHERHLSWHGRLGRFVKSLFGYHHSSILDPHPTHQQMEHFFVRFHDFGIALDYSSLLVHDGLDSEADARYITHNSSSGRALELGEFDCKLRLQGLPHDVAGTYITPPRVAQPSLAGRTWADLPLYTDICTGTVPVVVHPAGDAAARAALWRGFWMRPQARELLAALHRVARYEVPEDGTEDIGINLGGAWTDTGEQLSWHDLCADYEDELFGPAG